MSGFYSFINHRQVVPAFGTFRSTLSLIALNFVCRHILLYFLNRLTGLVVLSFAGDSESVDVETKIPRHRVQQQHWERPVGVVVVHQRVNLSCVQPVTSHITFSVKQGAQHFTCRQVGASKGLKHDHVGNRGTGNMTTITLLIFNDISCRIRHMTVCKAGLYCVSLLDFVNSIYY